MDASGGREQSLSRTGSEADSLLDLYGRDSANRSAVSVMGPGEKKSEKGQAAFSDYEDPNQTHWIHRDKLAKIESEELQQFGIQFQRRQVRASSKSSSRRGRSHDSYGNGTNGAGDQHDHHSSLSREEKRPRITSPPAPAERSGQVEIDDSELIISDPRLPEEIAADPYENGGASRFYQLQPGLRKSSSKIPILATSYHPIPSGHLERETPLPRTRNNTVGSREELDEHTNAKPRSTSESAPTANDTPEPPSNTNNTTPPQESRPGSRHNRSPNSPSKTKHSTRTRKTSAPPNNRKTSGAQKSKTSNHGSNGSSTQRPTTRSGDRPTTAVNRPEGDPPWLATMYKPDPRLPPDQQILPTHAKKIQQEQWEREGKSPSTYDREFAPLAVRDDAKDRRASSIHNNNDATTEKAKENASLAPPAPKSPDPGHRPGTSGTDHAGYKTMPTVQQSAPSPNPSHTSKHSPLPMAVEDSTPKDKGCGCCIVM